MKLTKKMHDWVFVGRRSHVLQEWINGLLCYWLAEHLLHN
jgi:hypothetical protein